MQKIGRIITTLLVSLILLVSIFSTIMLVLGYDSYKELSTQKPISSIYDDIKNNTENYVDIDDISKNMKDAIIAVEDRRFYTNKGVDYYALARALYSTVINNNRQGASTITMQLTKNYYYDFTPNLVRKFAEVFFAYEIDTYYEKDKILEMYLNLIYYGDGYTGIYEASLGYFNKSTQDLDLRQATLLAGIINAPARYQLSTGEELALKRQKEVLKKMKRYGFIDKDTYNQYMAINSFELSDLKK